MNTLPRGMLKPMLATLIEAPFDNPEWIFEIKFDGFRLLARIDKGSAALFSRNGMNVTERYAPIAGALQKIRADAVLDGELVVLDESGVSRFQLLQRARQRQRPLYYYVFDLLREKGDDLRARPLVQRKQRLKKLLPRSGSIRYSEHVARDGKKLFKLAAARGLEGIIAKRSQGRYHSGRRAKEWLKIKCRVWNPARPALSTYTKLRLQQAG